MNSSFYRNKISTLTLLIILFTSTYTFGEIYIRINQVGFLPDDVKTGIILSDKDLYKHEFSIINSSTNKTAFKGKIFNSAGRYGNFRYAFRFQFTGLKEEGTYFFEIENKRSFPFKVGYNVYNGIADSLLEFFKVQRCGYTEPHMHDICHHSDATSLIENGRENGNKHDVSGGWHDAGDYVKFLNTTAYATYILLLAYDFAPEKFSFDNNNNNVPDVLEEAKVGLDWLLRANYRKYKLITQV